MARDPKENKSVKSRLVRLLAEAIGTIGLLVMIIPILVYEDISYRKWKAGKNDGNF